jgi:hypothetical protein
MRVSSHGLPALSKLFSVLLVSVTAATVVASCTVRPAGRAPAEESQGVRTADADVIYVLAVEEGDGSWTFHVTIRHPDTGWDDYADGWDIVAPDGTVLKPDPESPFTRVLLHPHVNEQPITRSQGGIAIPRGVDTVRVRAHDIIDGFGGQEVAVGLRAPRGNGFEVRRTSGR